MRHSGQCRVLACMIVSNTCEVFATSSFFRACWLAASFESLCESSRQSDQREGGHAGTPAERNGPMHAFVIAPAIGRALSCIRVPSTSL
jgi:hypothetical protein